MDEILPFLQYVSGAITMGYMVAGFFFLRFWRRTRDGLFLAFACAFWLLAVNQALTAFPQNMREDFVWAYMLRLTAFILIIAAIAAKNIRPNRR